MRPAAFLLLGLAGLAGCTEVPEGSVRVTVLDHLPPSELSGDPNLPDCQSPESAHRFDAQLQNGLRKPINASVGRWTVWWTSSDPSGGEPTASSGPAVVPPGANLTLSLYVCWLWGKPAVVDLNEVYREGGDDREQLLARAPVDGWTGPPPRATPPPPG